MGKSKLGLISKVIKTAITQELNKNSDLTQVKVKHGYISNNTFFLDKYACLKDINMYKGIYYSRYFEWYGEARESFFTQCIIYDFMDDFDYAIATKSASCNYYHEIKPFETITISVNTDNIRHASTDLVMKIHNQDGILVADGLQTVLLLNEKGEIVKAPKFIIDRMKAFLIKEETSKTIKPYTIIAKK